MFRFAEPVEIARTSTIEITLRHDSPHKRHNLGRFRLSITDTPDPQLPDANANLHTALLEDPELRTAEQRELIDSSFYQSRPAHATLTRKIADTEKALNEHRKDYAKVMVMEDLAKPRQSFILDVGLYDKPGKEVTPGTPASLPPFPGDFPRNRLGLASWLVDKENPLTARVTVNRFWQQVFGVGLIKSPENFGVQSEVPIHPQLLDWLAAEFMDSGWDVKHLLRLIVTSHTYRQTSRVSPELVKRDPANRLLGRGARFRMPAWMIRDQALAASGLLTARQGGPPVNSYQPGGLWAEATFGKKKYTRGKGEDLYRRSLYSFWRRIAAPPMFFDNPSRETCVVKAGRTNTPLHALSTLNDVTYVEAARTLAARAAKDPDADREAQIVRAFELVLARPPSGPRAHGPRAQLRPCPGPVSPPTPSPPRPSSPTESPPRNCDLSEPAHAALATVCLGILNLDETLTKE